MGAVAAEIEYIQDLRGLLDEVRSAFRDRDYVKSP
jgi:hypothetical protein